jgi:hypothetical protein
MKRREVLKVAAILPAVAAAQSKTRVHTKKAARVKALGSSNEANECQILALFLSMMISQQVAGGGKTVTYWVDKFAQSMGNWGSLKNDPYFSYTTQEAYMAAYNLLVTQKKYPSLLAFQKDYRAFSYDMLSALSVVTAQSPADAYPDICPFQTNITALLDQVG